MAGVGWAGVANGSWRRPCSLLVVAGLQAVGGLGSPYSQPGRLAHVLAFLSCVCAGCVCAFSGLVQFQQLKGCASEAGLPAGSLSWLHLSGSA